MYNLNRKQKELGDTEERKRQLLQQIQGIKHKVSQLNEIQTQIQSISSLMKIQQQKNIRNSSSKSIDKKQRSRNNSFTNSNMKIKMYELRKKLEARNKQYKDQHVIYLSRLKKQEQIMTRITQLHEQIKNQKQMQLELNRLNVSMQSDTNRIESKCNQFQGLLANQKKVLKLFQMQKITKIQSIKKLKKIIKINSDQDTEPDDDIVYSIQQLSNDSRMQQDIQGSSAQFRYQLTQTNSPQFMSKRQNQQQILIQDDYQIQKPFYISFKPNNTFKQQKRYNSSIIKPNPIEQSKESCKSLTQLQHEAFILQQKLANDTKKYSSFLEGVSLIKRGNKNLQASLKHSMVTTELLKNRIQTITKRNTQQNRKILQNISQYQFLYGKLRTKQGERGELRGKLGIKVQNTRILSIINEQINLDCCKIDAKLPKLKSLNKQCLQLVKKVIGDSNQSQKSSNKS